MPDLDKLLAPKSITIIGASPDPNTLRGRIQYILQKRGFPGPIYPISRSHAEVQGVRAYPSVAALPQVVDLAMIVIPAASVPDVLEECAQTGIKAAYIISSGFAEESGESGSALQARMRETIERHDLAVCGPNAEGYFNVPAGIVATFSPAVDNFSVSMAPDTDKGRRISVVAQSGGLGFSYFHRGRPMQLRIDHVISTGNEAEISAFDFAEYLIDGDHSDILLMYLESLNKPDVVRRVAARAADLGKPMIVAKVGRSDAGKRAAASHTASMAGSDAVHDALFRRYGMIRVDDMDSQLDIAAAFAHCSLPRGSRVAVMSGSGGAGAWMSDVLVSQGLDMPLLDADTRTEIEALLPSYGSAANPVDLTAGAIRAVGYARLVQILQRSPVIDAVVIVGSLASTGRIKDDRELLAECAAHPSKPVLFCTYTRAAPDAMDMMAEIGIPAYTSMPHCARALRALVDYREFQERWKGRATDAPPQPRPEVREALRRASTVLCEYEAKALLESYDVPRPQEALATNPTDAAATATRIGYPVALKIQSPDIPHKTEMGGVVLNLDSEDAVRKALAEILQRANKHHADAVIHGVLVQKMAPKGQEIILGITRDPEFGPQLMVGLGGIHVEVLRDVAFSPVPLDEDEANRLLAGLKGAKLLEGVRGAPASDTGALVRLMVSLGRFAADHVDDIEEIDLNPVLVHPVGQGLTVVDALIVRRT